MKAEIKEEQNVIRRARVNTNPLKLAIANLTGLTQEIERERNPGIFLKSYLKEQLQSSVIDLLLYVIDNIDEDTIYGESRFLEGMNEDIMETKYGTNIHWGNDWDETVYKVAEWKKQKFITLL